MNPTTRVRANLRKARANLKGEKVRIKYPKTGPSLSQMRQDLKKSFAFVFTRPDVHSRIANLHIFAQS